MVSEQFQKANISNKQMTVLRSTTAMTHVLEGNSAYNGKNLKALYALPFAKLPSKVNQFDISYNMGNSKFNFGGALKTSLINAIEGEVTTDQILTELEKDVLISLSGAKEAYADTQNLVQEKSERTK